MVVNGRVRGAVGTVLGAVVVLLTQAPLTALPPGCDSELLKHADGGANGYKWRGDRCEGTYSRPTAGEGSFLIASLTRGRSVRVSVADPIIPLRWRAGTGHAPLHIRAYALRPRLRYQMDRMQAPAAGRYGWRSLVLAALELSLSDVGLVAWDSRQFGTGRANVYVPVTIGDDIAPGAETALIALPAREMNEVYVTVGRLDAHGAITRTMRAKQPLSRGSYAAQIAIEITLPELHAPGLYGIQLEGEVRDGGGTVATPMIAVSVTWPNDGVRARSFCRTRSARSRPMSLTRVGCRRQRISMLFSRSLRSSSSNTSEGSPTGTGGGNVRRSSGYRLPSA